MLEKMDLFLIGMKNKGVNLLRNFKERVIKEEEGDIIQFVIIAVFVAICCVAILTPFVKSIINKNNEAIGIIDDATFKN